MQPITADCLAEIGTIRHGFFSREGGVSRGIYASLNCGTGSGDERARVLENRARVAASLGAAGPGPGLVTCHQVHSAEVVVVDKPWEPGSGPKADGLVTRTPGIVLGVLSADCAPVLLCDPVAGVVGAAHAGWKGALGGVVEATIAAMVRLGARPARIHAALGPCIGPAAYEVGPDFEACFTATDPAYATFFRRPSPEARPYFDLPGFVLARLASAGLATVENATTCTYHDESRLFSYRRATHRGESDYGRQVSAIVSL